MSLILKEIDLPSKNQSIVIEIKPNGRCSTMKIEKGECYELTTKGEAKAIQIPTPHGRIIDEDEIYEQPHCGECNDATLDAINNAPTILEAEE